VTLPSLLALLFILLLGALLGWLYRGLLMSLAVRFLASQTPNAAKSHRLTIDFGAHRSGWIRLTLQADLGKTLSPVLGYPVEAAAYSRFVGFGLSRVYSDFLNPDSPYYQCWLGAYVVFDSARRARFGFDDQGQLKEQDVLAALEADQRLVFRSVGCAERFADGNVVQLSGSLSTEQVHEQETTWWRASGRASTWSAYHRGRSPQGSRLRSLIYGTVPLGADHPVDDYHPLTYEGEFWVRSFPEYAATCAKFCIWPSYTDRGGSQVKAADQVIEESRRLLRQITFTRS
jgi:hypothetical protein